MRCYVKWGLLCMGMGLSCWAATPQTGCVRKGGEMICSEGAQKVINGSGVVRINSTKVEDKVVVKGRALINNAEIRDLKVYGEAMINHGVINGKSEIAGVLTCQNTSFKQPLEISTDYIRAEKSSFNDIIIKTESPNGIFYMLGKTSVSGNVVFQGAPGKVVVSTDSVIKGKIINGTRA